MSLAIKFYVYEHCDSYTVFSFLIYKVSAVVDILSRESLYTQSSL